MKQELADKLAIALGQADDLPKELQETIAADVARIAPVVDEALRIAREDLCKPMECGHPLACLQLAPAADQADILPIGGGLGIVDPRKLKYVCSQCAKAEVVDLAILRLGVIASWPRTETDRIAILSCATRLNDWRGGRGDTKPAEAERGHGDGTGGGATASPDVEGTKEHS